MSEVIETVPVEESVAIVPSAETAEISVFNTQKTMWNDMEMMKVAYKTAQFLAKSDLVPTNFKKPENCLIALDFANRMGLPPLAVMQELYVVNGKPNWSGKACISFINNCGKFTDLYFEEDGKVEDDTYGCTAVAKRISDGVILRSDRVSIKMAKDEGWMSKSGSKWKTMPKQMARYRAATFFLRTYCPEATMGLRTEGETEDIEGSDPSECQEKTKITL